MRLLHRFAPRTRRTNFRVDVVAAAVVALGLFQATLQNRGRCVRRVDPRSAGGLRPEDLVRGLKGEGDREAEQQREAHARHAELHALAEERETEKKKKKKRSVWSVSVFTARAGVGS